MLPPEALVPYYTDARNRGYLANPARFPETRLELAKKYGYILPDITKDELFKMLSSRKDPRQIFFGLAPGWVVNMADKKILKPTDEKLLEYYSSWAPSRGASGRALEGVLTHVSHCVGSVCVCAEEDVFCVITPFFFFLIKIKNTVSNDCVEDVDLCVSQQHELAGTLPEGVGSS